MASDEGVMHWPAITLDDSTTTYLDDLSQTPSFGYFISTDAHPTAGGPLDGGAIWYQGCTGIDCPTLVGLQENLGLSNTGRHADTMSMDFAHYGEFPWASYLVTGDWFFLQGIYQHASTVLRDNPKCGSTACTGSNGRDTGHNAWGIFYGSSQTRSLGWDWVRLPVAAGLAPDGSPQKRFFTQKLAFQLRGDRGIAYPE